MFLKMYHVILWFNWDILLYSIIIWILSFIYKEIYMYKINIYIYIQKGIYIYYIKFGIFGGSVRLNSFKCFSFVAILDTEIIFEFRFLLYDCEDISACDKKDK